jgi:hypothetical protein
MLGAFVVRSDRIHELAATVEDREVGHRWPIDILAPSLAEVPHVASPSRFDVHALEIAPQAVEDVRDARKGEGAGVQVYHEVPLEDHMEARLDAIARTGAAAKVRTGCVQAEAFPSAERLAEFVSGCAVRGVPFKATAGLHHARRGRYPLTYERGSARWEMFGFLELALVAALLWLRRIDTKDAADLLREGGSDVTVGDDALLWSGQRMSAAEITDARRSFFHSFGSCSFEDPVADLTRMGLL